MSDQPAILGGKPLAYPELPFVRPQLPPLEELCEQYQKILETGMVTTGPYAEKLGDVLAQAMGVNYAIAVSSCTTGLLLTTRALHLPKDTEVILPSFTFMASGLGPVWNGLRLRFVDVDRETMNIDPQEVEAAINPKTSAIIGVHQFGNPAPIEELQAIADRHDLVLFFDAAHGFGSLHEGRPLGGFGKAEVFSMSPTKLLIAAEGGIVATNDDEIAQQVRWGRNYANPGNYDCLFPGLNARMSELHAILALHSYDRLEDAALLRNRMVALYRKFLIEIPGIRFQKVQDSDRSSYKDLSIMVDEDEFGISRDQLKKALLAEGIHTRIYYSPVLHQMKAFSEFYYEGIDSKLSNTQYLQSSALSLPLYSDMQESEVEIVCKSIHRIFKYQKYVCSA